MDGTQDPPHYSVAQESFSARIDEQATTARRGPAAMDGRYH
jgi:hypothetical protein